MLNRFCPTANSRSNMPSAPPSKLRTLAGAAAMALALPSAAGFAQDTDKAVPEVSGAPRNILPVDQLPQIPAAPPPEPARPPVIPGRAALAGPAGAPRTPPGPVPGPPANATRPG